MQLLQRIRDRLRPKPEAFFEFRLAHKVEVLFFSTQPNPRGCKNSQQVLGPKRGASLAVVRPVLKVARSRNGWTGDAFPTGFARERSTIVNPISSDCVDRRIGGRIAPKNEFFWAIGIGEPGENGPHEANKARELAAVIIAITKQGDWFTILFFYEAAEL